MKNEESIGRGRCAGCRGAISGRYERCRVCEASKQWRRERGLEPLDVHVVAQAELGSAVHERMRWYKDAAQDSARRRLSSIVAANLASWLREHPGALDGVEVVTCVPSARRASMEAVVDAVPALVGRHRRLVMPRSSPGRAHDPSAFTVDGVASGRRVLVVDDVLVSGATVLSAADALAGVGADVVGVLVMARLSRPPGAASAA